jgi:nitrate reductase NapD
MPEVVAEEVHISSLVVHVAPAQLESVTNPINQLQNAEVSLSDPSGKLVVLVEGEHENDILNIIKQIETLAGVLSVSMVFHQIDK